MTPDLAESLPDYMRWECVSSLVGSLRARCLVSRPENEAACRASLVFAGQNHLSVCARGGGFSYGDIILNHRNMLLDTSKMSRILDFDENSGLITVEPGVRIIDIFRTALHRRLTLAASPSASTITVAGAIGANVNGKDGWRMGNFGDQVVNLKLMAASGEVLHIDRSADTELFRAVVGGMGLLGIVVQATLQLRKIPSPYLEISRTPVENLVGLLKHLEQVEADSDFAVVWLDTCTRGPRLGRAVIHATKWVEHESSSDELQAQVAASLGRLEARLRQARMLSPVTERVVAAMLQFQKLSIRLFNELYFSWCRLRQHLKSADNVESFLRYNFDASFLIPSAAAVCGPRGYTVQVTFPRTDAQMAITELIQLCQDSPCLPAKLIMRVHRRDDYLISFSEDGYSLNFELHPKRRHEQRMARFVDDLIESVIRYGGKVHLAKDQVLSRSQFQRLFPEYRRFLRIKQRLDPDDLFQSDMYRRLMREYREYRLE
ncbi:MAG: FAD-binding oxidoreductase [Woeseiaceae bacterium]